MTDPQFSLTGVAAEFARRWSPPAGAPPSTVALVETLLAFSRDQQASDLHILPLSPQRLQVLIRIDGVLQQVAELEHDSAQIAARLKVLAHLLTYRTDVPQEGRIRTTVPGLEMRVSTFPTVHGEKSVVRLLTGTRELRTLSDLGYPIEIQGALEHILQQTSGLLIVCGPAGSGKTTTLYAALRFLQLRASTPRSISTLEDPVEALLPGVAQTQVHPDGELTYERGLASLMRQDPEILMVGEIRDPQTAQIAFQAALTGHLVLTSFHATSTAAAVSRLADMGIEPYVLRSGLKGVLAQRLLRRCCACRTGTEHGCSACRQTGYRGRMVVPELLQPDLGNLGRAILNREDAKQIEELAVQSGMIQLLDHARQAVLAGETTGEELLRVFGPAELP